MSSEQKKKSSRFTDEMNRALIEGYGKYQVSAELRWTILLKQDMKVIKITNRILSVDVFMH